LAVIETAAYAVGEGDGSPPGVWGGGSGDAAPRELGCGGGAPPLGPALSRTRARGFVLADLIAWMLLGPSEVLLSGREGSGAGAAPAEDGAAAPPPSDELPAAAEAVSAAAAMATAAALDAAPAARTLAEWEPPLSLAVRGGRGAVAAAGLAAVALRAPSASSLAAVRNAPPPPPDEILLAQGTVRAALVRALDADAVAAECCVRGV
jgi:trimeric autotransporter adhesin